VVYLEHATNAMYLDKPEVIFRRMEAQPVDQQRCIVAGVLEVEGRGGSVAR